MVPQPLNLVKNSSLSAPATRAFGPKTPTDIPNFTQTSSPPRIMAPRQRRRATVIALNGRTPPHFALQSPPRRRKSATDRRKSLQSHLCSARTLTLRNPSNGLLQDGSAKCDSLCDCTSGLDIQLTELYVEKPDRGVLRSPALFAPCRWSIPSPTPGSSFESSNQVYQFEGQCSGSRKSRRATWAFDVDGGLDKSHSCAFWTCPGYR
ncbi:hypothetical protein FVEG_13523 [Fusarium verticillioides 7600]|uniref:Uncharacterized protein n=1 Tax=Gibberella moniliformis (strain M3125 / FGSC 7600) TaxID=334819 RepID=W7MW31_GIBM7|nr:hypothetical protein FVEG_13523 [Fusarium verticillioides 7600]EWG55533.1 hypothetical protein FVEG_13523 [Fusarium verticillioides 7600]